jgi:hypothetical protein
MKPVVNGLEEIHGGEIDFVWLNAGFGEGREAFLRFGLLGHPSYLLLSPDGEELWRGVGPFSAEELEQAIVTYLPAS